MAAGGVSAVHHHRAAARLCIVRRRARLARRLGVVAHRARLLAWREIESGNNRLMWLGASASSRNGIIDIARGDVAALKCFVVAGRAGGCRASTSQGEHWRRAASASVARGMAWSGARALRARPITYSTGAAGRRGEIVALGKKGDPEARPLY